MKKGRFLRTFIILNVGIAKLFEPYIPTFLNLRFGIVISIRSLESSAINCRSMITGATALFSRKIEFWKNVVYLFVEGAVLVAYLQVKCITPTPQGENLF